MASDRIILGWREWLGLPDLGIARIRAKIDTGARTSALHAFRVERYRERGAPRVRLHVHPDRRDRAAAVVVETDVVDERTVSDSGGHRERRIVVASILAVGGARWPIELTITNRDTMRFPMLLGRTAMAGRIVVDPERSYVLGQAPRRRARAGRAR